MAAGLKEICFTDHIDYDPLGKMGVMAFDTDRYNEEYDNLEVPGLKIRRGMEFGMDVNNREQFKRDLQRRPFDFVLGSIHFVDDLELAAATFAEFTGMPEWRKKANYWGDLEPVTPWMELGRRGEYHHYQWYPFINIGHFLQAKSQDEKIAAKYQGFMKLGLDIDRCMHTSHC